MKDLKKILYKIRKIFIRKIVEIVARREDIMYETTVIVILP